MMLFPRDAIMQWNRSSRWKRDALPVKVIVSVRVSVMNDLDIRKQFPVDGSNSHSDPTFSLANRKEPGPEPSRCKSACLQSTLELG